MKAFADLYAALDETTKTSVKVAAMRDYFASAPPADAAWAVYFLSGRKPKQVVPTRKLAAWATEAAGVSDWLFEECYHAVGDLGEAIALLLPAPESFSTAPLHEWVEQRLLPLRGADEAVQRAEIARRPVALDAAHFVPQPGPHVRRGPVQARGATILRHVDRAPAVALFVARPHDRMARCRHHLRLQSDRFQFLGQPIGALLNLRRVGSVRGNAWKPKK